MNQKGLKSEITALQVRENIRFGNQIAGNTRVTQGPIAEIERYQQMYKLSIEDTYLL